MVTAKQLDFSAYLQVGSSRFTTSNQVISARTLSTDGMSLRQLQERTKRCVALSESNEAWIDAVQNTVEELEFQDGIMREKLIRQERDIHELKGKVRYLQTVVDTLTSPAFSITQREEGIVIFTNSGRNKDTGAFFPHGPQTVADTGGGAHRSDHVTPVRGTMRPREPTVRPLSNRGMLTEVTESVKPITEEVKKQGECLDEDRGNYKRARRDDAEILKLTFDETATQSPRRQTGSQ